MMLTFVAVAILILFFVSFVSTQAVINSNGTIITKWLTTPNGFSTRCSGTNCGGWVFGNNDYIYSYNYGYNAYNSSVIYSFTVLQPMMLQYSFYISNFYAPPTTLMNFLDTTMIYSQSESTVATQYACVPLDIGTHVARWDWIRNYNVYSYNYIYIFKISIAPKNLLVDACTVCPSGFCGTKCEIPHCRVFDKWVSLMSNFSTYCNGTSCHSWGLQQTNAYSGENTQITGAVSSVMTFDFVVTESSTLVFEVKVTTSNYNLCRGYFSFYLDAPLSQNGTGALVKDCGVIGGTWYTVNTTVSTGRHQAMWVFQKSAGGTASSSYVYLRNVRLISLPPTVTAAYPYTARYMDYIEFLGNYFLSYPTVSRFTIVATNETFWVNASVITDNLLKFPVPFNTSHLAQVQVELFVYSPTLTYIGVHEFVFALALYVSMEVNVTDATQLNCTTDVIYSNACTDFGSPNDEILLLNSVYNIWTNERRATATSALMSTIDRRIVTDFSIWSMDQVIGNLIEIWVAVSMNVYIMAGLEINERLQRSLNIVYSTGGNPVLVSQPCFFTSNVGYSIYLTAVRPLEGYSWTLRVELVLVPQMNVACVVEATISASSAHRLLSENQKIVISNSNILWKDSSIRRDIKQEDKSYMTLSVALFRVAVECQQIYCGNTVTLPIESEEDNSKYFYIFFLLVLAYPLASIITGTTLVIRTRLGKKKKIDEYDIVNQQDVEKVDEEKANEEVEHTVPEEIAQEEPETTILREVAI
jgi:hypothetical protein